MRRMAGSAILVLGLTGWPASPAAAQGPQVPVETRIVERSSPRWRLDVGVGLEGWWGRDMSLDSGHVEGQLVAPDGAVLATATARDDPGAVNAAIEAQLDRMAASAVATLQVVLGTVGEHGAPVLLIARPRVGWESLDLTLDNRQTGTSQTFEGDGPAGGADVELRTPVPFLSHIPGLRLFFGGGVDASLGAHDATRKPALTVVVPTTTVQSPQRRGLAQTGSVKEDPELRFLQWRVTLGTSKDYDFDKPWLKQLTVRAGIGWEQSSLDLDNRVTSPAQTPPGATLVQVGSVERSQSGIYGAVGLSAQFTKAIAAHADVRVAGEAWGLIIRALWGF